jgi:hypothetical protein
MNMRASVVVVVAFVALAVSACQTTKPQEVLLSQKSPVELRAMQGRVYDTTDRPKTIRTVIATLQDLGYSIEKVEAGAGTVSARKLAQLEMTVSVFPRGQRQMTVRANAVVRTEVGASQVDAPEFYQQLFFEPLSKALFLTASQEELSEAPTSSPAPATSPAAAGPPPTDKTDPKKPKS